MTPPHLYEDLSFYKKKTQIPCLLKTKFKTPKSFSYIPRYREDSSGLQINAPCIIRSDHSTLLRLFSSYFHHYHIRFFISIHNLKKFRTPGFLGVLAILHSCDIDLILM